MNGAVTEARLIREQCMTLLTIDGKATPPLIFFFNTEVPSGWKFLEPQVRLAAEAGVHLYSFCLPWPWWEPGVEPDYAEGERFMEAFLEIDPEALFIPRMRCEGPDAWLERHPETRITYSDGGQPMMNSLASDLWWDTLHEGLARAIRHYESSRFGDRIVAYHPASQNSNEWFHFEYWLRGADYSESNVQRFRQWLRAKYDAPRALAKAWHRPDVTFENATIPAPCHEEQLRAGESETPFAVFCGLPEERQRVDFHDYTSAIVAERLEGIAALIKQETNRRKLVVMFYGYLFEMHGAESGHFAMEPVLQSSNIDILSSPLSYLDRQSGGCGGFMTAVDSVVANGKLWVVENDYRTHSIEIDQLPEWMTEEGLGPRSIDLNHTLGVVKREFGAMLSHRCGTWWMDLIAAGAFADPAVWKAIHDELAPLYDERVAVPAPFHSDVAIIVDEASLRAMRYPAGEGMACYSPAYDFLCRKARGEFGRTGVDCGWYYLADLIAGRVPPAKVYWFPNLFRVDDDIITSVLWRLDDAGATAVWQYAPGCFGAGVDGNAAARRLTGFNLVPSTGAMGSSGAGALDGLRWGHGFSLNPRMEILDGGTEPLGRYDDGHGVSAGRRARGNHESVFVGDVQPEWQAIARILEIGHVHRWTRDGGIVSTDGQVLFVHYGEAGRRTIHLPRGVAARELGAAAGAPLVERFEAEFAPGQTRIFRLTCAGHEEGKD